MRFFFFFAFLGWVLLPPALAGSRARLVVTAPRTADKGSAVQFTYDVSGAPKGASIGFFLEKVPADTLSPGPQGPLSVKSEALPEGGKGIFLWDGKSFGCAPTDAPSICATPLEPGQYRLRAQLYDREEAYLIPLMMAPVKNGPREIGRGFSNPFSVSGKVDTSTVESRLLGLAAEHLVRRFDLFRVAATEIERYVDATATLRGPDGKGAYCRTFYFRAPFAGAVEACAPNALSDEGSRVTGEVRSKEGTVSYDAAKNAVLALARLPYLNRVKHRKQEEVSQETRDGKGLDASINSNISIANWAYREDGSFWAFVLEVGKASGNDSSFDRPHNLLFVRVNEIGIACIVRAMPFKGGDFGDIFRDAFVCAGT